LHGFHNPFVYFPGRGAEDGGRINSPSGQVAVLDIGWEWC
jgi:hypothetical protein